ncbi:TonB family protein [Pontibacter sp. 13R65]|uniref:TonB family protein n=1 Tax=Pontibacter sp. 13R65 TaxID=3127458 RepID=UPI00301C250A
MRFLSGPLLLLCLLLNLQTLAHVKEQYYDKDWNLTKKADSNAFYLTITYISSDNIAEVKTYKTNGAKVSVFRYRDYHPQQKDPIKHGPYQEWHNNGQLSEEGHYLDNKLHGKQTQWYENGQISYLFNYKGDILQDTLKGFYETGALRRIEVYEDGLLVDGIVYGEDGAEINPFFRYQQMPEFPGGIKAMFQFLSDHIQYPGAAVKRDISGIVYISFTVTREGKIQDIFIRKGVHKLLDAEAIRIIKAMPDWYPGRHEGRPVPVRYNMPVKFTLE